MSNRAKEVTNGKITPCPSSPNCVSTLSEDESKKMAPLAFHGDVQEAKSKVKNLIQQFEGTSIVSEEEDFLHATFQTKIFKFTDDVKFYFDTQEQVVHFKSSSRMGYSDLGKNRSRMEKFTALYND